MHGGFRALRNACPMNLEASLHDVGATILAEQPQVKADLDRLTRAWSDALKEKDFLSFTEPFRTSR